MPSRPDQKQGGTTLSTSGTFVWNGTKSTLTWDNPRLGKILEQQGFSLRQQEDRVRTLPWKEQFAGCKLASRKEGDQIIEMLACLSLVSSVGRVSVVKWRLERSSSVTLRWCCHGL